MHHSGIGTLFYPDGREWGQVRYAIDEDPPTAAALGRIVGRLSPLTPTPLAFFDFMTAPHNGLGWLHLSDGRWWRCSVSTSEGRAVNSGQGFYPAGPMPTLG
jgi:hypothetical protein